MFPVLGIEIGGLFTISLLLTLCNMAGIGGSGDLIPLLIAFFHFETKQAIAITGFAIFVCAVVRYIYIFRHKHPQKDAVVIDYSIASVMLPTIFIGSFLGVMVNIVLPNLVI